MYLHSKNRLTSPINFSLLISVTSYVSENDGGGNYQINNKSVSERLSYALRHSTDAKIETIGWNALRTQKNIYEVTCTVKMGNRERYFKWWANLSSNRISPLNMDTQEIHGGGFY